MSVSLIILYYSAILTSFIPRAIPVVYTLIAGLLLRGEDPLVVSLVVFLGAVGGTIILWAADEKVVERLHKKNIMKRFSGVSGNSRLKRTTKNIHEKLQVVNKKGVLFLLTCFTTRSAIPDFVIIRCVRKKLGFFLFLVAALIGKAFVYTPIIYGVELIDYVMTRFM